MTDTNHIEVLRRQMDNTENSEVRAALDAAITALSARASAGEGGEHPYRQLQKWWEDGEPIPTLTVPDWAIASAYRQAVSKIVGPYFRAPNAIPWAADITVAADWAAQEWRKKHPDYALDPLALAEWLRIHHRCSEVKDWERLPPELLWIYESLQRLAKLESAAPQPAQAGASGGEAGPRARLRQHVMESVAKSGSGAVLVSAGEVAALFADYDVLAAAPHPQPPINSAETYSNPIGAPAHGDGEVLGFLRKFDADFIARKQHGQCQVIIYQERPRKDAVPLYTATRHTPEAQEARDAARFIVLRDALLGTNTAAMEYFKSNGAPTSVEQFNAYCDAALALPAQGEGS